MVLELSVPFVVVGAGASTVLVGAGVGLAIADAIEIFYKP